MFRIIKKKIQSERKQRYSTENINIYFPKINCALVQFRKKKITTSKMK